MITKKKSPGLLRNLLSPNAIRATSRGHGRQSLTLETHEQYRFVGCPPLHFHLTDVKQHILEHKKYRRDGFAFTDNRRTTAVLTCTFSAIGYCRIQLQVAYEHHFLHKIRQGPSPYCRICRVPKTVDHFLLQCIKYAWQRRLLQLLLTVPDGKPLPPYKGLGLGPMALLRRRALLAVSDFAKETDLPALW